MLIFGLTIPKFIGAIIIGLVVSFGLIVMMVPHEDKPVVVQQPIQQPLNMNDMEFVMVDTSKNVVMLTIGIMALSIIMAIFGGISSRTYK
jgi:hypothetical protein